MQNILTGCYMDNPKGHSHISKHCGAGRKKINEKTFKTKAAAEKYFNKLLGS